MKLIYADLLYDKLTNFTVETTVQTSDTPEQRIKKIMNDVLEYYKKTISEAPKVDAVPIVRCEDCVFSHRGMLSDMTKEIWCTYWQKTEGKAWNLMRFNDFCSHGEKKLGAEINES